MFLSFVEVKLPQHNLYKTSTKPLQNHYKTTTKPLQNLTVWTLQNSKNTVNLMVWCEKGGFVEVLLWKRGFCRGFCRFCSGLWGAFWGILGGFGRQFRKSLGPFWELWGWNQVTRVEWDWIASVMSLRCSMGRVPEDRSELKETAAEWEEMRTTVTLNEWDRMKDGEIKWERMRERERERVRHWDWYFLLPCSQSLDGYPFSFFFCSLLALALSFFFFPLSLSLSPSLFLSPSLKGFLLSLRLSQSLSDTISLFLTHLCGRWRKP